MKCFSKYQLGFVCVLAGVLMLTACSGNEVDLKDVTSVAKFSCEKQKQVIELIKAEKPDEDAIIRISEEVEKFDNDLNAVHGDTVQKFRERVDLEIAKICPDATLE
jgi:hypothetical protein